MHFEEIVQYWQCNSHSFSANQRVINSKLGLGTGLIKFSIPSVETRDFQHWLHKFLRNLSIYGISV